MRQDARIRIVIAADWPLIQAGLCAVVARHKSMQVVGVTSNGLDTVSRYRLHVPDVVVMDLSARHRDGLEATKAILTEYPTARIIIISASDGDESIYKAMCIGARAYLLQDTTADLLLETIQAVADGQTVLSGELSAILVGRFQFRDLSAREQQVLEQIVASKSNREIACALLIGEGTVKAHVNHLLDKLHAHDRTEAALIALKRGLVSML